MTNFQPIGVSNYNVYQPPTEELINNTLPSEMLAQILFKLEHTDTMSALLVCKHWKATYIKNAGEKEFTQIKNFEKFLLGNPKLQSDEKEQLKTLLSDRKILASTNLEQIKSSIEGLKETLLNVLKDLKEEDLTNLEMLSKDINMPKPFENIFQIAKIYKMRDVAYKEIDSNNLSLGNILLNKVSRNFMTCGLIDKGLEVTKNISDDFYHFDALRSYFGYFLDKDNFDMAIKVANMFRVSQKNALKEVCQHFLGKFNPDKGLLNRILDLAKMNENELVGKLDLMKMARFFLRYGDKDRALETAELMSSLGDKYEVQSWVEKMQKKH